MKQETQKAYVAALKALARRDFFREELRRKLSQRGHDDDAVEAALARCRELGYLDDTRIAARFVEVRAADRGWGPARVRAELRARGVGATTAESAARLSPSQHDRALKTALRKAEVRAAASWWRGGEGRFRMVSSLVRRGFEPGEARQAVDRLAAEREAQTHAEHDQQGNS